MVFPGESAKSATPSMRTLFQTVDRSPLWKNWTSFVTARAHSCSSAVYCRFQPSCDFWTKLPTTECSEFASPSTARHTLRFFSAFPLASLDGRCQVIR